MRTDHIDDPDAVLRQLATQLARMRHLRKWTQRKAAEQIRQNGSLITAQSVSLHERGERELSVRHLLEFARAYQISAPWLLAEAIHLADADRTSDDPPGPRHG